MPIYDVTVPIFNELPTWPGDPSVNLTNWRSLAAGDGASVSMLNFGAHTATHVDAPAHFIEGAAKVESRRRKDEGSTSEVPVGVAPPRVGNPGLR